MKRQRHLAILCLLSLTPLFFSNCTVAGYIIGSGIDEGHRTPYLIPATSLYHLPNDTHLQKDNEITITFKNGKTENGRFKGLSYSTDNSEKFSHFIWTNKREHKVTPIDEIKYLYTYVRTSPGYRKGVGLLIGLFADAMLSLLIISNAVGDE